MIGDISGWNLSLDWLWWWTGKRSWRKGLVGQSLVSDKWVQATVFFDSWLLKGQIWKDKRCEILIEELWIVKADGGEGGIGWMFRWTQRKEGFRIIAFCVAWLNLLRCVSSPTMQQYAAYLILPTLQLVGKMPNKLTIILSSISTR